jgi:hypothetical protein
MVISKSMQGNGHMFSVCGVLNDAVSNLDH